MRQFGLDVGYQARRAASESLPFLRGFAGSDREGGLW